MGFEIQADANDFGRSRDYRQEFDISVGEICRIAKGGGGIAKATCRQGVAQRMNASVGHARCQINDPTVVFDHAEAVPPIIFKADESHKPSSTSVMAEWLQTPQKSALGQDPENYHRVEHGYRI
jgi:hypothetical protein